MTPEQWNDLIVAWIFIQVGLFGIVCLIFCVLIDLSEIKRRLPKEK